MVYLGPHPGMTLDDAKARLPVVMAELRRAYAEPGLGERSHVDNAHLADLEYERHVLERWLAPEHFRGGLGGWLHRLGCTLQREQNGVGAKCRQARELVELLNPRPDPNNLIV